MSPSSSPSTPEPGPPESKTTYAHARLRQEIIDGSIRPGEPLRQADLARRFGISPTPVREALRLLEAEGMISYSSHRGATVAELSEDRIRDLYLLRSSTESLATRLAVERMQPDAFEEIEDVHARLSKAVPESSTRGEQLAAWNREWHHRIYTAGSPFIGAQIMTLWRMFPARTTTWQDPAVVDRFMEQHGRIMDAMVAGDAERAGELMHDHIATAGQFRLRMLYGE